MPSRHQDWLRQAQRDLGHARHSLADGDHEWACFAAHQAAEKAAKALYQKLGAEAWGHSVTGLLQALPDQLGVPADLVDAARALDRHYIPPRYPNAHPAGAPFEFYTERDAQEAVENARAIVEFCQDQILR